MSEQSGPGYILEVDLLYPTDLHLPHNSYPLAPEQVNIVYDNLSDYSQRISDMLGYSRTREVKKLGATFGRRRRYLLHALNLRLYLDLGLKLLTIHRGITFYQKPFLRSFITTCSEMRMAAKTPTEQSMWKLLANSLYGKFIESMDLRMDCRFNRDRDRAMRNASSPLYKGTVILEEDFSISFMQKRSLVMKQSWAVGFSVLELSKWVMQTFYYRKLIPIFGEGNVSVIMSDTDSFLVSVKASNEAEVLQRLADEMDLSNLPTDHPLFDESVKKVPGYFKTEVSRNKIEEAVALRSKCYALRCDDGGIKARAKGVTEGVKRHIPFSVFRQCVESPLKVEVLQHSIRSTRHVNQLLRAQKVAFTSFDDKRFLLCSIHSVPYGSWVIDWYRANDKRCFFCLFPHRLT